MLPFSFKTLPARYVIPLFLLIVFLGPVVLGPPLYYALTPFHVAFHRAMNRALLISALGALFLFRDRLRLRAWWPGGKIRWIELALGWFVALVSAQAMMGFYLAVCGVSSAEASPLHIMLVAGVAALIVPLLEETIFRGFLVTTLVEAAGRRAGWVLAAFIYTLAHFLKIPSDFHAEPVGITSGAIGMLAAFGQLGHGDFISGRGLNLFLVGLILGGVFLRLGRLWLGAGLHGGWIFSLMTFTGLTRPANPPRVAYLGGDLLSSPVTSIILVAVGVILWRFYPPRSDEPETVGKDPASIS